MIKETLRVPKEQYYNNYMISLRRGLKNLADMVELQHQDTCLVDEEDKALGRVNEEIISMVAGGILGLYGELREAGFGLEANAIIETATGIEQEPFSPKKYPDLPYDLLRSDFAKKYTIRK